MGTNASGKSSLGVELAGRFDGEIVSADSRQVFKGLDLGSIPGVSRGFVGSSANALTDSAMQKLFSPGDRVRHPKFGAGKVTEVTGQGKEARIRIRFDTAGEKELALSIAPIVKAEDTV